MNWKNFKALVIGGGILGVLTLLALVGVFLLHGQHKEASEQLESATSAASRLQNEAVFPSSESVKSLDAYLVELTDFQNSLSAELVKNTTSPTSLQNVNEFNILLERTIRGLRAKAAKTDVVRPKNKALEEALAPPPRSPTLDAFGKPIVSSNKTTKVVVNFPASTWLDFDVYGTGIPPDAADLPLLTVQLKTIQNICETLMASGISGLVRVERQKFDKLAQTKVIAGRFGPTEGFDLNGQKNEESPADDEERVSLYDSFDYGVTFTAPEPAVWKALQALVNLPLELNLTGIEISNTNAQLQPSFPVGAGSSQGPGANKSSAKWGVGPGAAMNQLSGAPDASSRLTAGGEDVEVTVHLKIFRAPASEEKTESVPETR